MAPLAVVAVIGTMVTIVAGTITLADYQNGRRIRRSRTWPIPLRRSVRFSDATAALHSFLDEQEKTQRFAPDVVVGVHYGGMVFAAEAARAVYKTLSRAVVLYTDHGENNVTCESVTLDARPTVIRNKRVLVVDNSIRSGLTLKMAVREVQSMGAAEVKSLVVFQAGDGDGGAWKPSFVLFRSKKRLKSRYR